jgi:hypothetical protein
VSYHGDHGFTGVLKQTMIRRVVMCMVGRLSIPLKQAIKCYQKFVGVFSERKLIGAGGSSTFKMTKMKEVLKEIVRDATGDENTRMVDTREDADKCRTYGHLTFH